MQQINIFSCLRWQWYLCHHSLEMHSINRFSQARLPERFYYSTNTHYKLLSAPAVTCQCSQPVCRIYDSRNRIFLYGASYLSYMMEFTWVCSEAHLNDWLCTPKAEMYCKRTHSCECYYHLTRLQFIIEGFPSFLYKMVKPAHIFHSPKAFLGPTRRRVKGMPLGCSFNILATS